MRLRLARTLAEAAATLKVHIVKALLESRALSFWRSGQLRTPHPIHKRV